MKKLLVILLVLLIPTVVFAAPLGPKRYCIGGKILYNEVVLNGAAGTRTKTITGLQGYDKIRLSVQYTHASSGTLTFVFTALVAKATQPMVANAPDTTYGSPTTSSCSAGVCTLTLGLSAVTPTLTGSTDFDFYVDLDNETALKVVATESTATAAEKLTVTFEKCVAGGQ